VAAAYEILHSYLLIHDDIIDQDEERRGKPTLHVLFQKFAPPNSSNFEKKKIGEDIAIIIGDLANIFSQKLLLETNYSVNKKVEVQKYINNVLEATCSGQILDILSLPNKLPNLKQQQSRYLQKTAIYTIEAPFLVGLSFGKGIINKRLFRKFANNVGLAFQLADDVHNIFGSSLATRQSDLQAGKVTYLISLAIKKSKYKRLILNILKKNKKNKQDLLKLRRLLIESGGYQCAMSIIYDNFNQAEKILKDFVLPENITNQLHFFLNKLKNKLPEAN
jgi:geranylgeranyl pyrophosphate synthase